MKKIFALILTILITTSLLTGCMGTTVVIGNCTCPPESHQQPTAPAEGAVKLGLSVTTKISDSVSATAESAGKAAYDLTLAAVLVDDRGVILDCIIDSVPATVKFDATGAITTALDLAVLTKNEQGANYGMVAHGNAKYEWDVQVAEVAKYAIGKTVDQLKNGDIDMVSGKAKDGTDLSSKATIYLAGYVYAIEAAVNNAIHLGAQAGDELVLTTLNSIGSSVSATEEKNGTIQLDCEIVALTRNDGKITSCYIDSVQAKISIDATGTITTDLTAPVKTKNQLGADYGMVAWGGAKYEWDRQAAEFASYVTGKTAQEVADIAISESTKPADGTDLSTTVTISIAGFQALIAKAMAQ